MLDFSTILLPVDLKEPSLPAVQQAAMLARHFHSKIVIVHVLERPADINMGDPEHKAIWSARVLDAEKHLDESLHEELAGIVAKRVVLEGQPAEAIAQAVIEQRAKLVVMGTHGVAGLPYFLLGSVATKLLTAAACPIWVAPHPHKFEQRLGIHNVLCGVGLNPGERLIPSADQFAREFAAKLTLAHVTPEMQTYAPGGQFDIHGVTRQLTDVSSARLAELKQQNGVQAEVYIGAGEVPAVLDEAAHATHADVLIIGRRPRPGWYGGSTYPIISSSHIPVLSI